MSTKIKMNLIQRIMVQHANPSKFTIDTLAILLAIYFLWYRDFVRAMAFLFGLSFIGTALVWGKNENALARTPLGRWMIGQAHPMNLLVRGIGTIAIAYGCWAHGFLFIAIGIVLLVVGRHWVLRLPNDNTLSESPML